MRLIQRSDHLSPADIKRQCMRASSRIEEDQRVLEIIGKSIDSFAGDLEIKSESFEALKQQLSDYHIIIEAMQIANATDMADFKVLGGGVGDEILDGETIFAQMENSLKMKESYLASEEIYRRKMQTEENVLFYILLLESRAI